MFVACFKFTKWKKHVSEEFSSLENKKQVFEAFWSVFQVYKIKTHVWESFSYLQNKKHVF